jgi:L-threonylcarbamoyladenylate synthase
VSQLCTALDAPIVSTSANPTGRAAARSALRVRQYFGKSLDLVVPGQLGDLNGASEIRDLVTGEVIRGRTR